MKIRSYIIYAILITAMVSLTGCGVGSAKESQTKEEGAIVEETGVVLKKISSEDAQDMINNDDIIILDVRSKEEYDLGHIKDSVLLPVDDIEADVQTTLPEKDKKILVYCRSGNRSATAARKLSKLGYTQVYDFGGINTWPGELVK